MSYKEKQGALNALETMLITKEYHLQVKLDIIKLFMILICFTLAALKFNL